VPGARRLFVALEPTDPVRRRLATTAADLKRSAGRAADEVRWVQAENVHLTLQFLGAVPDERVAAVEAAVREAAAGSRVLSLEVKGAGGFPNARRPRVVWVGLQGDLPALAALVQDLGRRLAPLGFAPEARPYARAGARRAGGAGPRGRARRGGAGRGCALARGGGRSLRVAPLAARAPVRGPRAGAARRRPVTRAPRCEHGPRRAIATQRRKTPSR